MKKRILAAFLALAMVITILPSLTLPARAVTPDWATSGEGTAAKPYIISSYDKLNTFAGKVNDGTVTTTGTYFKLADNFPTSGTKTALEKSIGDVQHPFNGTFDGNARNVELNISLSGGGSVYAALFGCVTEDGTVKNVGISGKAAGTTTSTRNIVDAGGAVGINKGVVENCYADVNVTATVPGPAADGMACYAGGVVAHNIGTVTNCHSKGEVTAKGGCHGNYAGGVVGYNEGGKITNCDAVGTVTATDGVYSQAGGVVGKNTSTINNCCANATVTATSTPSSSIASYAGGVVGQNSADGIITNCYAMGAVSANNGNKGNYAGGMVGYNEGGKVANCYATGTVSANVGNYRYAGGVVGKNIGAIENCYATGMVTGKTQGGVVGKLDENGTVTYCYYLKSDSYNGISNKTVDVADSTTALPIEQMQAASGTTKLAWTEISGSKRPLVDALNSYAKANGYASWKVAAKETYPTFMQKIDYELDWFDVDAESYEIKSYAELEALAYIVNSGIRTGGTEDEPTYGFAGKTVKLSDKFPTDEGKMTTAIGSDVWVADGVWSDFWGTFNGNNKTVELNIDMTGSRVYAGLFGYLNGAVQNVSTKGTVTANGTSSEAGGVVGNSDYGRVTDCSSECEVTGNTAGGVIGNSSGAVTNCHATGSITGGNAGGVVGENHSTIASCYATGDVAGYNAGGVVGNNTGDGRLINCYAAGNVKGYNAGGVAGNNDRPITNCYATGDVTGTTVGGVVGTISSGVSMITNCYAAGKLEAADTSTSYIGGVVGKFLRDTIITDCYYRKGMAEYGVAAYYYEETTTPATEEDPNTLAMSEANMKAVSGKASLVERLHDYVVKNPDSYLFDWVTDGLRYPVFAENVETASKVKTARLDNLYAIPEDAVLVVGGVKLNGIKYELTENGYLLKNAAGKYLKVSGRQLVTVDAEKDATPWFYNGGLYAVVNVNRGCGGFFRTPHYVKYYLAAAPNGVAYASLLFAPAVAQYEGLVMVDAAVSLDYTVSTAVVGALKKYSYTFTVNAPENAEVYYKIGTVESFGRTFTMLYKPAFVYIRIVNDGVSTNWKATLTRTGYEVSYVG